MKKLTHQYLTGRIRTAATRSLRFVLTALILASVFTLPTRAEYSKLVSITGGSPANRFSDALLASGYTGSASLDEATICNLSGNANTFYLGSASSVNASTGFPLAAGVCMTYRAAGRSIDATSLYLFTATTQSAAVSLRGR